tara:strand:+ start:1137 stop:1358 length:222 start_codon:yes stop_codon:yes gene_type:complete
MASKIWMTLWVTGSAVVMLMLFGMVHGVEKEQAVLSYQIDAVLEKLVLHTEKLEIIQGSQYEILRQIDSLKEK